MLMNSRVLGIAARVAGTVALAGLVSCSAATSGTPKARSVADVGPQHSYIVEADSTDRMFTRPREERTEAYITGRFG